MMKRQYLIERQEKKIKHAFVFPNKGHLVKYQTH